MSSLLLGLIRLYRRFWPSGWKRSCLFRESCSRYVYRITAQSGAWAGILAVWERARQCRAGYSMGFAGGQHFVRLRDGSTVDESEVSPEIFRPYRDAAQALEDGLRQVAG